MFVNWCKLCILAPKLICKSWITTNYIQDRSLYVLSLTITYHDQSKTLTNPWHTEIRCFPMGWTKVEVNLTRWPSWKGNNCTWPPEMNTVTWHRRGAAAANKRVCQGFFSPLLQYPMGPMRGRNGRQCASNFIQTDRIIEWIFKSWTLCGRKTIQTHWACTTRMQLHELGVHGRLTAFSLQSRVMYKLIPTCAFSKSSEHTHNFKCAYLYIYTNNLNVL